MPEASPETSFVEKAFNAINYFLPENLGDRSDFSQDIGRVIDKGIGLISRNPCRGCDNYYEVKNGVQRSISPEVVKVESSLYDESGAELNGLVATCRDKLPADMKGKERFKACNARWGQGYRDQIARDFDRWAEKRS